MKRLTHPPRPNWRASIEESGMLWHTDSDPFWNEGAYYEFTPGEIDHIESSTETLYSMCLEAAEYLMTHYSDETLHLPHGSTKRMHDSFIHERDNSIYARFDLCYRPEDDTLKMYEINGDTPTMLVESSITQWLWAQDIFPNKDQFNSIHERLVRAWSTPKWTSTIHFTGVLDLVEEAATLAYLADTAEQAGHTVHLFDISGVGHRTMNGSSLAFTDDREDDMGTVFKLYPLEDMLSEAFGPFIGRNSTQWIEPLWKQALSHKALLAALWTCFPNHPLLIPASLNEADVLSPLAKPFFGREGHGMHENDTYADGNCYQMWHPLPDFDGHHPVIGSWIIDGEATGMGIRESSNLITDGNAQFTPHIMSSEAPSQEQRNEWLMNN